MISTPNKSASLRRSSTTPLPTSKPSLRARARTCRARWSPAAPPFVKPRRYSNRAQPARQRLPILLVATSAAPCPAAPLLASSRVTKPLTRTVQPTFQDRQPQPLERRAPQVSNWRLRGWTRLSLAHCGPWDSCSSAPASYCKTASPIVLLPGCRRQYRKKFDALDIILALAIGSSGALYYLKSPRSRAMSILVPYTHSSSDFV